MFGNITLQKEVLCVMIICMVVTMDRYTRYYVNQSGSGEIGMFRVLVSGFRGVTE